MTPDERREYYQHPDVPGAGAERRRNLQGKQKMGVVMGEHKRGTLRSGSGEKVTDRKQAIAIAMSEAGMARKKKSRRTLGTIGEKLSKHIR